MKQRVNVLIILVPVNKFIAILFFLFCCAITAHASASDSLTVAVDSSRIAKKHFSENLPEKYSGNEFNYDSMEGEAENFLGRAINWFFNKIGEIFGFNISPKMYHILKYIIYALLIVFALYIIVKLLVGDNASAFFSRKSKMVAPLNIQEEHIENIDLDSYIKNALKEENYRLAIRYMYLKSLKLLSLHNIIDWHFDKTNTDYYREIENEAVKEKFKKTSYLYDNIWYGEFTLDKAGFENAKKDFELLNQNLKMLDKRSKRVLWIFLLALLGIVITELVRPKPIDWRSSYTATDKIPFGSYIFFEETKTLFGNSEVIKVPKDPYEFLVESSYAKKICIYLHQ